MKRPDAFLDLIDAMTVAGYVESPVALSEATPFRRKFSMVYDTHASCSHRLGCVAIHGA